MTGSDDERDEEREFGAEGGKATGAESASVPPEEAGQPSDAGSDEAEFSSEEPSEEVAQLDLGDEGAALPWLEGDDEEEYEEGGSGQLIALLLLGLLAIVLVVGGIWWMTRKPTDSELVADGSVIEAPDKPYKEKPEDPGGKTFEGTGDTSFAVSQGETRPARLGEESPQPKPGFATLGKGAGSKPAAAPTKAPAPAPSETPSAAEVKGVGVQVGAFSTRVSAEAGWTKLSAQYDALSGVSHRVVEGQADIGTVYRLQALAKDAGEARALCKRLRTAGLNCQVKN